MSELLRGLLFSPEATDQGGGGAPSGNEPTPTEDPVAPASAGDTGGSTEDPSIKEGGDQVDAPDKPTDKDTQPDRRSAEGRIRELNTNNKTLQAQIDAMERDKLDREDEAWRRQQMAGQPQPAPAPQPPPGQPQHQYTPQMQAIMNSNDPTLVALAHAQMAENKAEMQRMMEPYGEQLDNMKAHNDHARLQAQQSTEKAQAAAVIQRAELAAANEFNINDHPLGKEAMIYTRQMAQQLYGSPEFAEQTPRSKELSVQQIFRTGIKSFLDSLSVYNASQETELIARLKSVAAGAPVMDGAGTAVPTDETEDDRLYNLPEDDPSKISMSEVTLREMARRRAADERAGQT